MFYEEQNIFLTNQTGNQNIVLRRTIIKILVNL